MQLMPTPAETESSLLPALESLRRFECASTMSPSSTPDSVWMRRPCARLLPDEILFVVTALADTYVQLKLILRRSGTRVWDWWSTWRNRLEEATENPGRVRPPRGGVPRSED